MPLYSLGAIMAARESQLLVRDYERMVDNMRPLGFLALELPRDNIHHSQLLNTIILKFTSPVLLNLLGNIFPYCPAVEAILIINSSSIDLPGRSRLDL